MAKTSSLRRPLIVVILVFIESLLSLALRLDKGFRETIFPLVKKDTVWRIRTYLPHVIITATFTENGILLDHAKPDTEEDADVRISGSMLGIIRALLLSDETALSKLQYRGDETLIELSKTCSQNMGLQHITSNMIGGLRKMRAHDQETKQLQASDITRYKETIETQNSTIENLNTELAAASHQVAKLKKRQTGFTAIITFCIGIILYLVI